MLVENTSEKTQSKQGLCSLRRIIRSPQRFAGHPQGLKPLGIRQARGTAEAVPLSETSHANFRVPEWLSIAGFVIGDCLLDHVVEHSVGYGCFESGVHRARDAFILAL